MTEEAVFREVGGLLIRSDDSLAVHVTDDPAAFTATLLKNKAKGGLLRGRRHIALSGGSTPREAYRLAADGDWSRADVWLVDDRAVPPDDERSNHRLVNYTLEPPKLHRIEGELGAEAAADRYAAELGDTTFDFVLLGLGPDGHTASLFPGKPEAETTGRRVVAVPEAGMEPYVPRVSLTLEAINSAKVITFLIAGADKAEMVDRVFRRRDTSLPAARVKATSVICDSAAWGA